MNIQEISSMKLVGFPILSCLVFGPLLLCGLLMLLQDREALRRVALGGALLELLVSLLIPFYMVPGTPDMQFVEHLRRASFLGAGYHLGVDGLSAFFVPLTAFLTVVVLLSAWRHVHEYVRAFLISVLALESFTLGVLCSLDLALFFIFWELLLVPSYSLISLWGLGVDRHQAALKYVLYMLAGSAPLLVGFMLLGQLGMQADGLEGAAAFDLLGLMSRGIPAGQQLVPFLLIFLGFAVKAPLFPLHTWLPLTLQEGPVGLSVMLVGLKLGLYGMLRFVLPLFPEASLSLFPAFGLLGLVGMLYGALLALRQPNLRRLMAFASLSHVAMVLIGFASLNQQGLEGGLLQMLNFALTSSALFLLVGGIYQRLGTTEIASMGGLAAPAPLLAAFFLVVGVASVGFPGTSGFVGESLILLGAIRHSLPVGGPAFLGVILSGAGLFWAYERVFLGPVKNASVAAVEDLQLGELTPLLLLAILSIGLGLVPGALQAFTQPSIAALSTRLNEARPLDTVAELTSMLSGTASAAELRETP